MQLNTTFYILDMKAIDALSIDQIAEVFETHKNVFARHFMHLNGCEKLSRFCCTEDSYGILAYREPLSILESQYKFFTEGKHFGDKVVNGDGDEVLVETPKVALAPSEQWKRTYKKRFDYTKSQQVLDDWFPKERQLHIVFEKLIQDNQRFAEWFFESLGIKVKSPIVLPKNKNASYWPRSMFLHRLINKAFCKFSGLHSSKLYHAYTDGIISPSLCKWLYDKNKRQKSLIPDKKERKFHESSRDQM